jgi:hypothetical protein
MQDVTAAFRRAELRKHHYFRTTPREEHWEEDQPGWRVPENLIRKKGEGYATEASPASLLHRTPRGMTRVNYINEGTRQMATFERIVIGPYEFFALRPFVYDLPLVRSLDDVQCCLTPLRRPERQDQETACEFELMREELDEEGVKTAKELIEEFESRKLRLPDWDPRNHPRDHHEDDDLGGAGSAPIC